MISFSYNMVKRRPVADHLHSILMSYVRVVIKGVCNEIVNKVMQVHNQSKFSVEQRAHEP